MGEKGYIQVKLLTNNYELTGRPQMIGHISAKISLRLLQPTHMLCQIKDICQIQHKNIVNPPICKENEFCCKEAKEVHETSKTKKKEHSFSLLSQMGGENLYIPFPLHNPTCSNSCITIELFAGNVINNTRAHTHTQSVRSTDAHNLRIFCWN